MKIATDISFENTFRFGITVYILKREYASVGMKYFKIRI